MTAPHSLVLAQRKNSLSDRVWLPCNFPRPFLKDTVSPSSRPPLSLHPISDKTMSIFGWLYSKAKAFDSVDHNQLWKILKEMGIPDHLTCLLRHLYAGQGSNS